jgi:hypothetical protein
MLSSPRAGRRRAFQGEWENKAAILLPKAVAIQFNTSFQR